MPMLQFTPIAAMCAIIAATILRGITIRQRSGDHPLAFLSATGLHRWAGLSFAISTIALIGASFSAAMKTVSPFAPVTALFSLIGALLVIVAQVQMGRAWRIGVREGDAPLFVSHGLFRFSRNPIFVGMILVGMAAALAASTSWAWAALMVFVVSCAVQVRIEERHLEASFGQAYREFCANVPRWIGMGRQR